MGGIFGGLDQAGKHLAQGSICRLDRSMRSLYVLRMAAANASARGQRAAILASPLHELTGFLLAVDCLAPGCNGERSFAVTELASFYGRDSTVGEVLRRMRCSGACGGRVVAAWLETGPILNARVRPWRVPLRGPEALE
jgi:hypothetical protein